MLAASLPIDVWFGVAFIAAITVLACLAVIAKVLRYELEFIRVVASAKNLRDRMMQRFDETPVQEGDQANPAAGRPEMIGSPSPMPASAESAETEAIIDSPPDEPEPESDAEPEPESEPDAEPAATEPAQAA